MSTDTITSTGNFIELGDGSKWYPGDPEREFYPETVAKSLSKLCRFTGHVSKFYSVAEHSVKVSYMVPHEQALAGLMHDAHEMLIADLAKPLKVFLGEGYKKLERVAEVAVRNSFGLPLADSAEVKLADIYMVLIEGFYLMPGQTKDWTYYDDYREMATAAARSNPYYQPSCWSPDRGAEEFIHRFNELTRG